MVANGGEVGLTVEIVGVSTVDGGAGTTCTFTQIGLSAVSPTPKIIPFELCSCQLPCALPTCVGAVKLTDRSKVWPGATCTGKGTAARLPIAAPDTKTSL